MRNSLIILFCLMIMFLLSSCSSNNIKSVENDTIGILNTTQTNQDIQFLKFKYFTEDGFGIYGNINKVKKEKLQVLILHDVQEDKTSYSDFISDLNAANISTIIIDIRGHGESKFRGKIELSYQDLTPSDYQKMSADLNGILNYLDSKNISSKFSIIGFGLGANIATDFASKNNDIVDKLVLVSPSLNYYGITTIESAKKYNNSIYIITSDNDELSFTPSETLFNIFPGLKKEIKTSYNSGHGRIMLYKDRGLTNGIIFWLTSRR